MELRITINMDNEAFQGGNDGAEVARILHHYAQNAERYGRDWIASGMASVPLRDLNGNRVGEAAITADLTSDESDYPLDVRDLLMELRDCNVNAGVKICLGDDVPMRNIVAVVEQQGYISLECH